jgi:hypothetical protein
MSLGTPGTGDIFSRRVKAGEKSERGGCAEIGCEEETRVWVLNRSRETLDALLCRKRRRNPS